MATCFIDDLVLEILPLLPLKSQARFRSVSKQWRSLISNDPRHVRALLLDCRNSIQLLPLDNTPQYPSLHQPRLEFHLLQSCNGLLLLGRRVIGFPTDTTEYHVYNPLSRQHITLPLCPCCLHSSRHVHVTTASLAYEPSKSPHYKLICLCRCFIMIYSSLTSSWTCWANRSFLPRLKAIVRSYHYNQTKTPVYWNGSVYYHSNAWNWNVHLYKLYRFDVDREAMLQTRLPRDGFEMSSLKRLVESWGRLYILGAVGEEVRVYEMESDHSGWRLKYRLDDFGRDLKVRFCRSRNDLKIRLGGRKIVRVPSHRYEVFFPAAESGGEDELWLVVLGGLLVYRYGLGSKSVVVVRARHHGHPKPFSRIKAHEYAQSILELPRPLQWRSFHFRILRRQ